jgi:hypothetical protein
VTGWLAEMVIAPLDAAGTGRPAKTSFKFEAAAIGRLVETVTASVNAGSLVEIGSLSKRVISPLRLLRYSAPEPSPPAESLADLCGWRESLLLQKHKKHQKLRHRGRLNMKELRRPREVRRKHRQSRFRTHLKSLCIVHLRSDRLPPFSKLRMSLAVSFEKIVDWASETFRLFCCSEELLNPRPFLKERLGFLSHCSKFLFLK